MPTRTEKFCRYSGADFRSVRLYGPMVFSGPERLMKRIVVWFTGRGRCCDASLNGSPYTVARLAAAIMSLRGFIFVLATYQAVVAYSIGPSSAAEVVCLDKFDSDYQIPT